MYKYKEEYEYQQNISERVARRQQWA